MLSLAFIPPFLHFPLSIPGFYKWVISIIWSDCFSCSPCQSNRNQCIPTISPHSCKCQQIIWDALTYMRTDLHAHTASIALCISLLLNCGNHELIYNMKQLEVAPAMPHTPLGRSRLPNALCRLSGVVSIFVFTQWTYPLCKCLHIYMLRSPWQTGGVCMQSAFHHAWLHASHHTSSNMVRNQQLEMWRKIMTCLQNARTCL